MISSRETILDSLGASPRERIKNLALRVLLTSLAVGGFGYLVVDAITHEANRTTVSSSPSYVSSGEAGRWLLIEGLENKPR